MISRKIATACVAASLAFAHTTPAVADAGDAVVGGIIGGIIGGVIVSEANKKKTTGARTSTSTSTRSTRSTVNSAEREANREVQVSLNHFGFAVGTPDGALGPRSRSAISEYQMMLGYPATGQLTEYERTLLLSSYHRAVAGGALTLQQASTNPMGMRGLLLQWRDEAAGVSTPGTLAAAPGAATGLPNFGTTTASSTTALPSFMGLGATTVSLTSHCQTVNATTTANGGFTTIASMPDPLLALSEQFCMARGEAIEQGAALAAKVAGFTPDQIAQQCAGFGPAMKETVVALSLKPAEAVLNDVQGFIATTGMPPAQLAGTAKICLSVGYQTEDMDVAIGSALLLATLGEQGYGEFIGHHLAQGFGTAQRPDLALGWFEMGLDAANVAVSAQAEPGRVDVIRKAAYTIAGKEDEAAIYEASVPAVVPGFTILPADAGESVLASSPEVSAPEAGAVLASDTLPAGGSKVGALPMAARLPFLLFRN